MFFINIVENLKYFDEIKYNCYALETDYYFVEFIVFMVFGLVYL